MGTASVTGTLATMMTARPPALPDAVLFDMDGLLVDTEPLWFRAETRVVDDLGGVWTKQNQEDLLGSNLEFAAEYMLRLTGSDLDPEVVADRLKDTMTDLLRLGQFDFCPGALDLLTSVRAAGLATALVTSSVREHLEFVLLALPPDGFDVLVTGDDVARKKPDPQPYQLALTQLGVAPRRTVVLEDSPAGVTAGESAGCTVIAVPSVLPIDPTPTRPVYPSLESVDLDVLSAALTRS
jgi:HAD superfamily hydrolase (TIGR01509 family)